MRITSACLLVVFALHVSAASTRNDDSCDLAVLPAATLLLPYFEVAVNEPSLTTLFTVTNVGPLPQVALVTLWSEYAYPVASFHLFLTGYDVQSINLYDVIGRGRIARGDTSHLGKLSDADNPVLNEASCADLPTELPAAYVQRMQFAFAIGRIPGGCQTIGGPHTNAVGYAIIDVVGACSAALPIDPSFFNSEIRFDNVLIGDYQQINANGAFAQGNAMVHIRAIPEGGTPATRIGPDFLVDFPRTFYSRYQPFGRTNDARQPLPSLFAARWIGGGPAGFETELKIWREGTTTATTLCSAYPVAGGALGITEVVRFDENENPETHAPNIVGPPVTNAPVLPSTSTTAALDETIFPPNSSGAIAGWFYLNLDSQNAVGNPPASQNWVIVSMSSNGYSVDFEAASLGNGCTPETDQSEAVNGANPIGPPPN